MSAFLYQLSLIYFAWGFIPNTVLCMSVSFYSGYRRKWSWAIVWALLQIVGPFVLLIIKHRQS